MEHRRYIPDARKRLGEVSNKVKKQIIERDGNKCLKCGIGVNLEIHHITPLCLGGDNQKENLATLCFKCHKQAPDDKINFEKYVQIHLPPNLAKSRIITKAMISIILSRYGFVTEDKMEEFMANISIEIDDMYLASWGCCVSGDISKLSEVSKLVTQGKPRTLSNNS
jgi:hypothetical protein